MSSSQSNSVRQIYLMYEESKRNRNMSNEVKKPPKIGQIQRFSVLQKQHLCFSVFRKTERLFLQNRGVSKYAQMGSFWAINPVSKSQNSIVASYWFRFTRICVHLDYAVVDKVYEFRIENQIGGGQFSCLTECDSSRNVPWRAQNRRFSVLQKQPLCFSVFRKTEVLFFCF